jgi:hypothetical protein
VAHDVAGRLWAVRVVVLRARGVDMAIAPASVARPAVITAPVTNMAQGILTVPAIITVPVAVSLRPVAVAPATRAGVVAAAQ